MEPMLVITVARHPLAEGNVAANVLKYGTGAINIDACRVQGEIRGGVWGTNNTTVNSDRKFNASPDMHNYRSAQHEAGRWPANLILSHHPDCGKHCSPFCPVADVERQAPGASTYFFQVRLSVENIQMSTVPQDLLDYLYKLITPTHVGGKSLIALDLDAVDWKAIPDNTFHGMIAQGEPTPEQTEHIWRVVKPGAHVLLIAPDSCPTGHRGAISLEDKGFEIRDSILWVREAGRIHYVPKANRRERNAGCEIIAERRKGIPMLDLRLDLEEEDSEGLFQALIEAGVSEEIIEAIEEAGIQADIVPEEWQRCFKKRENPGRYGNFHPTVKPKSVLRRLLKDVPKGATVLDPFCGSGSMGLACLDTGHSYIGIEREADYCEIADARLRYWMMKEHQADDITLESEAPQHEDEQEELDFMDFLK